MPMTTCPKCRMLINVSIPQLEVPSIALALLPAIVAAEWEHRDDPMDAFRLVEAAYEQATAYVEHTKTYLRAGAVSDG